MFSLGISANDQGLAYAGLALGTYLTLRILNFPDLTVGIAAPNGLVALAGALSCFLPSLCRCEHWHRLADLGPAVGPRTGGSQVGKGPATTCCPGLSADQGRLD
jgi:hypothetical protein